MIEGVFDSLPGDPFLSLDGLGIGLEKDIDTVPRPCSDLWGSDACVEEVDTQAWRRLQGRRASGDFCSRGLSARWRACRQACGKVVDGNDSDLTR